MELLRRWIRSGEEVEKVGDEATPPGFEVDSLL